MLEIRYVWEWPVRITHWVNFACILALALSGLYIAGPPRHPVTAAAFTMGWIRFLHFSFGYLFAISVLSRLLWLLLANHHASWKAFLPLLFRKGRRSAWRAFKYYTFLSIRVPYGPGHNGLAATVYAGIFLLFLVEIGSGFTLYGLHAPGGWWHQLTAPLLTVLDVQWLRLVHHAILWLIVAFVIIHVYLSWLLDIKMKNGLMSSIFSGYKFIEPADIPD